MKKIPCVMMRGGTSRGAFLLAEHLPEDQTQRDKILMAIMGSGNDLEIDGIGGGNPLTSKVAIISRSAIRVLMSIICLLKLLSMSNVSIPRLIVAICCLVLGHSPLKMV